MPREFASVEWDELTVDDCRQLIRLAVREDFRNSFDWTTVSIVGPDRQGEARLSARQSGVVCGVEAAKLVIAETDAEIDFRPQLADGDVVQSSQSIGTLSGSARDLLSTERLLLNFLGRLSGIATKTKQYAQAVHDTSAAVYDTRKTTPGWRRLEKYAVRCGGGHNHRCGLYDAVLIKDNHLALADQENLTVAQSVATARRFLDNWQGNASQPTSEMIIEVEVDTLEQLRDVLDERPDVVLLDNMPPAVLEQAVALRNERSPETTLEASGGITLDSIHEIATTGVERISVGALTHSAINFDIGLDWVV